MRGCVLPVPHSTAVSKGEEMNVFLFSYYFCPDSNISWPTLDTDLSRHFSFVPLPVFQFPNLYFALQSVAGRLLLCAQKPQECGRVTDHTHHTHADIFMKSGQSFSIPLANRGRWRLLLLQFWKSPVPFHVNQKRTVPVCGAKPKFKCPCAAVRWSWVGNLTAPKHRSQKSSSDSSVLFLQSYSYEIGKGTWQMWGSWWWLAVHS